MKSILIISSLMMLGLMTSPLSMASVVDDSHYPLPEDAIFISPIEGKVLTVKPLCPKGTYCIQDGTVVTVAFTLNGCVDELANVNFSYAPTEKTLFISATNVHREASSLIKCFAAKTEKRNLSVNNLYGDFTVKFLGTSKVEAVEGIE